MANLKNKETKMKKVKKFVGFHTKDYFVELIGNSIKITKNLVIDALERCKRQSEKHNIVERHYTAIKISLDTIETQIKICEKELNKLNKEK